MNETQSLIRPRHVFTVFAAWGALLAVTLVSDGEPRPRTRPPTVAAAPFESRATARGVEDLHAELRALAADHPAARYDLIGASHEGRPLAALRLGSDDPRHPSVYIHAGLHAREWMTHILAVELIRELLHAETDDLLRELSLWVVPLCNPDGYAFSRESSRRNGGPFRVLWRKNRRRTETVAHGPDATADIHGVDLNRNFDVQWGRLGSDDIHEDTYRGPAPASEPEVSALQRLVEERSFVFGLDIHSGGAYQIHAPARHDREAPPSPETLALANLAARAFRTQQAPRRYGPSVANRFLFEASPGGQAVNFLHRRGGMQAFTVEIGRFFVGVAEKDAAAVVGAWRHTIGAWLEAIRRGPGVIGRITDARTGDPVAARIRILDEDESRRSPNRHTVPVPSSPRTGRYGCYLTPGRYVIEVEAEGYAHESREVHLTGRDPAARAWRVADFELAAR